MPRNKRPKAAPGEVKHRWTAVLVQDGWTAVSNYFLKNYSRLGISSLEAMFIIHLLHFKWNEHMPYPTFKTLSERMGLSDAATRTHARNLERKKYLMRIRKLGDPNTFDLSLLFEALEQLKAKEAEKIALLLKQLGRSGPAEMASAEHREAVEEPAAMGEVPF
jgi:DNA-binding MarR family transcriptional regulator